MVLGFREAREGRGYEMSEPEDTDDTEVRDACGQFATIPGHVVLLFAMWVVSVYLDVSFVAAGRFESWSASSL